MFRTSGVEDVIFIDLDIIYTKNINFLAFITEYFSKKNRQKMATVSVAHSSECELCSTGFWADIAECDRITLCDKRGVPFSWFDKKLTEVSKKVSAPEYKEPSNLFSLLGDSDSESDEE